MCRDKASDRCFSNYAPEVWNALPLEIRKINNVETFKRKLKNHLYDSMVGPVWFLSFFLLGDSAVISGHYYFLFVYMYCFSLRFSLISVLWLNVWCLPSVRHPPGSGSLSSRHSWVRDQCYMLLQGPWRSSTTYNIMWHSDGTPWWSMWIRPAGLVGARTRIDTSQLLCRGYFPAVSDVFSPEHCDACTPVFIFLFYLIKSTFVCVCPVGHFCILYNPNKVKYIFIYIWYIWLC